MVDDWPTRAKGVGGLTLYMFLCIYMPDQFTLLLDVTSGVSSQTNVQIYGFMRLLLRCTIDHVGEEPQCHTAPCAVLFHRVETPNCPFSL